MDKFLKWKIADFELGPRSNPNPVESPSMRRGQNKAKTTMSSQISGASQYSESYLSFGCAEVLPDWVIYDLLGDFCAGAENFKNCKITVDEAYFWLKMPRF